MSDVRDSAVGRGTFLGLSATAGAIVALPAAAMAKNPWPRKEQPCDDKVTSYDVDDPPWHNHDEAEDNNDGVAPGHALSLQETQAYALELVSAMLPESGADLRASYYHLIRTWKKKKYLSGGTPSSKPGGKYGGKYVALLTNKLSPPRPLQLDDIANIHLCAVLYLRRALLALTAHDVDPDASMTKQRAKPGNSLGSRSFHWGPNDGSSTSYNGAAMVNDQSA